MEHVICVLVVGKSVGKIGGFESIDIYVLEC